jgi:hypothetical protein
MGSADAQGDGVQPSWCGASLIYCGVMSSMKRLLPIALVVCAVSAAFASGPLPPDYPYRVRAVRFVEDYRSHNPNSLTPDVISGHGYGAILDRSGPLEALELPFSARECFSNPDDLYYAVGGFYPARWVNDHKVAIATNVSGSGKIHECRFTVKRSAIPNTPDYHRLTVLNAADMTRIYDGTSTTNPPPRPLRITHVYPPPPPLRGDWIHESDLLLNATSR